MKETSFYNLDNLQQYAKALSIHDVNFLNYVRSNKHSCSTKCYLLSSHGGSMSGEVSSKVLDWIIKSAKYLSFDPCAIAMTSKGLSCQMVFKALIRKAKEEVIPNRKVYPAALLATNPLKNTSGNTWHPSDNQNFAIVEVYSKSNCGRDYKPCIHTFENGGNPEHNCLDGCECAERGFCEIYCNCHPKFCKIRKKGCACNGNCLGTKCVCFSLKRECEPSTCKCCFGEGSSCKNQYILDQKRRKNSVIGKSRICDGLGLYSLFPIKRHEFVIEYIGEYLTEQLYDEKHEQDSTFIYLISLTENMLIEAKYFANEARFINHSRTEANLYLRIMFSRGAYHLAFYALRNIDPGEELYFDYDGNNTLFSDHEWITMASYASTIKDYLGPFVRLKRVKQEEDDSFITVDMTNTKKRKSPARIRRTGENAKLFLAEF
eukprot:TRINITY_DN9859_c0_g1_i1.p1 TRINITY_DN9859_c0_g1~~TRINITY_DN9859_c0_g1_i1.p1  ORF type:complete len:432 (-),score=57.39 TRINITY_DN9859_c0_g1_i1:160-1455(-)